MQSIDLGCFNPFELMAIKRAEEYAKERTMKWREEQQQRNRIAQEASATVEFLSFLKRQADVQVYEQLENRVCSCC